MVALVENPAPTKRPSPAKNRAPDFFAAPPDRADVSGFATRTLAGKNERFSYDACRGVSLAQGGQSGGSSRSGLGNALRHVPILGGILGGVGDVVSGVGNMAVGNFGNGFSQIGGGLGRTVGHVWGLPNTAVGLAYGAIGLPLGAGMRWDSTNAVLQVTNHPLMLSAMSLGDVNIFGPQTPPNGSPNRFGVTAGQEEALHSIQSRVLGPLYFPAHIIGGVKSWMTSPENSRFPYYDFWHRDNFMENGPMTGEAF